MLAIVLGIEEVPSGQPGEETVLRRDEIRVESTSFEEGVAAAKRQVPLGWRRVWVRVEQP